MQPFDTSALRGCASAHGIRLTLLELHMSAHLDDTEWLALVNDLRNRLAESISSLPECSL
jgi:hypothetical protein